MEFTIENIEDWQGVAEKIIPKLKHTILLLRGNLGAGKTTFTQALVKKLGSGDNVSSPTYSIVNEYDTPKGKVFHFDLYRLTTEQEVFETGIEEYLENGFLNIIEWPEIYSEELKDYQHHEMTIENTATGRIINFY